MFGQLFPAGGGKPIALRKDEVVIGRAPKCDITVPSRAVSGRHCVLRLRNGYWWIKDLDSRNGTGIDGRKITEKRILPNETLCIPKMRFRISYQAPHEESSRSKEGEMSDESMAMSVLAAPTTSEATANDDSEAAKTAPVKSRANRPDADTAPTSEVSPAISSKRQSPSTPVDRPMKRFLGKLTPRGGGMPIALLEPNLIIGRSRSCNIRLKVSTVSSRHCSLSYEDGHWFVEDLSSNNGVKVNGERVERRVLMPGDIVGISTKRFVIDYTPVGEPPRDMSLFSKSLLEKAGLQNILEADNAPAWITSHETHDDEAPKKYRLDDSDPD